MVKEALRLKAWLEGKKTHLVAVALAVKGLCMLFVQHDASQAQLVNYLLAGGGLSAVRAAISKVEAAVKG